MPLPNSDRADQPTALRRLWQEHAGTVAVADAAYATLRQAILVGALRPGDRLAEEQLAGEFGISRTPIREAIFRGVRTIPEEQVLEVFTVRAALDRLAASIVAQSSTAPERARLHWINEQIEARML